MCVYYYVTYYYSVSNMALTVALTLKCLGNQSHITTGFPKLDFFGFIFHTIVDKADKRMLNDSRENETKKLGLGKPVVIWD